MIQDSMKEANTAPLESLSDEQVLRASKKNPALFAILVERYEAPFLRKARSIVWSPEDAEEVVQDAFLPVYTSMQIGTKCKKEPRSRPGAT